MTSERVSSPQMWVAYDGARRTIAPIGSLSLFPAPSRGPFSHLLPSLGGVHRHCREVAPFISLTTGDPAVGSPFLTLSGLLGREWASGTF